jgi:hypothetical protein
VTDCTLQGDQNLLRGRLSQSSRFWAPSPNVPAGVMWERTHARVCNAQPCIAGMEVPFHFPVQLQDKREEVKADSSSSLFNGLC